MAINMFKIILRIINRIPSIVRNASKFSKSPVQSNVTVAFGKYLFITNTLSSGVLMIIGDLCQQEIEYRGNQLPERYDFKRLTHMFIVGLGLGPIHHYYYIWLANILPARSIKTVTLKILLDQFIMSPICIAGFFYTLAALEMKPVKQWNVELIDKFKEVYMMDWCVWPPTQFINFYYVPVVYQVFYINFVTMLYNIFLSYIKYREVAEEYVHSQRLVEVQEKRN